MLRGHATLIHLVGKRRKLHPSVFSFGADENVGNANVSTATFPLLDFFGIESLLNLIGIVMST